MNFKSFLISILLLSCMTVQGENVDFGKHFNDSTLRIDFISSGNTDNVMLSLKHLEKSGDWWGRRVNLDKVPRQGNGQIIMTDAESRDTIFMSSFSTLFQEWLTTDEAKELSKAMDGTVLVPEPKNTAEIELKMFNGRRETIAKTKFMYNPADPNVRIIDVDPVKWEYLWQGGDSKEAIDVVILGEGYAIADMDSLRNHALIAVESILNHEPFKSRKDDFNFILVYTESKDNGLSVPQKNTWKSTAFDSHYNTFYSARYLTTTHTDKIHDALRNIPYEHIIILANENTYGGGGIYNFYTLTTARNREFRPVVVHEFGHSFGGLADEYFYESGDALDNTYPLDIEPWEGNISTLVDFDDKWANILEGKFDGKNFNEALTVDGVGVFEGGGYLVKGMYRPTDVSCRMRFNNAEAFCPVCRILIDEIIDYHTK